MFPTTSSSLGGLGLGGDRLIRFILITESYNVIFDTRLLMFWVLGVYRIISLYIHLFFSELNNELFLLL